MGRTASESRDSAGFEPLRRHAAEVFARALVGLRADPGSPPEPLRRALVSALVDALIAAWYETRGVGVEGVSPPSAGALVSLDLSAAWSSLPLATLDHEHLGALYEGLLTRALAPQGDRWVAVEGAHRRSQGSHFTARRLAQRVVALALKPLVDDPRVDPRAVRIYDPAMGTGAFLLEAARQWSAHLVARCAMPPAEARMHAVCVNLCGADLDPLAARLARASLRLVAGASPDLPLSQIVCADGLTHDPGPVDAVLGNPPWVSYVGRAAQPLDPALRRAWAAQFASFRGYRNLQGLFVERAAALLSPRGRLGLVLPASMAELAGYAPTRAAHDRLAVCDDPLPDLGADAFEGVFQPAMVLLSTRRDAPREADPGVWPLARTDLDAEARAMLDRFGRETLPAALFGDLGVHTTRAAEAQLVDRAGPGLCPLRVGADLTAWRRGPALRWGEPARVAAALGDAARWARVKVLIRQTARHPVAAFNDGVAFRNSLLAGFEDDAHPAGFVVAYLNSTALRWRHQQAYRDARNGIPQVKVGHLRATPRPPSALIAPLDALGRVIAARNDGIRRAEQLALDALVDDAFAFSAAEREKMRRGLQREPASAEQRPEQGPAE